MITDAGIAVLGRQRVSFTGGASALPTQSVTGLIYPLPSKSMTISIGSRP